MKISCKTLFNCSETGVTGHFRPSQVPFNDNAGNLIEDQVDWNRSRNIQRNWETLLQIIGLRTQPTITQLPYRSEEFWHFEFETEVAGVYSTTGDVSDISALLQDCNGVPMLAELGEKPTRTTLSAVGPDQNIWFETVNN